MILNKSIVVAVDGHSSCGKSTFAKLIAEELNYIYIDSGAMYRAVALYALHNNLIKNKVIQTELLIQELPKLNIHFKRSSDGKLSTFLNDKNIEAEIRGVEVSGLVSEISKIKEVRSFLVKLQQQLGDSKSIVMDGRDIGTVVFPNAEIKLFMTADAKVRAQRRFDELTAKNISVSFEEILQNVIDRDYNDTNRKESPLIKANDAIVLDNSHITIQEQLSWFIELLNQRNLIRK
jgi:cytidylate kinase